MLGAVGGAAVLSGGMLVVAGAAPAQAQGQAAYSFVANTGADSVTEYAMGASGNETPVATISGPATGLDGPEGVAVDSAGDLFVANINVDSVTEYAKGATGNTAPVVTISGFHTKLSSPTGVTVDSAGHLFVTNPGGDLVTEYAKGATGNATPVALIAGSATGLSAPLGVAVDSAGHLFVANTSANSVTEYAEGATGNATPVALIAGSATGLSFPHGVAVDSAGHLFVANSGADSVTEYAEGATGNATPVATISGSATGLSSPDGVAVAPALGSAPVLRFDAHAYGVHARVGRFTVGPTAPANLTCTTKPGSIRRHAFHTTTTTAGGTRAGDGSQRAKATSTVSGGQPGVTASGSISDTATAATNGTSSTVTTSGSATFTRVKIDGTTMPYHPAPNTTLHLARGTLVLNEQLPVTDSSGVTVGITVNAIDATFGPVHAMIGHASAALTAPGTTCPAP